MKTFLRLDDLSILSAAVGLYILWGGNWWLFVLFAILPDISLLAYIGYEGARRWPSLVYNTFHTYALPILGLIAFWSFEPIFLLGWVAHIAVDRLVGYGFKSAADPKQTHLQQIKG